MSSTTSWLGSALALAMLASCVESETYTPVGDLTVSVPESFDIRNDSSADLPVTVTRGAGHTKAIALEVLGLPAGLTADPAEIPAGESAGTIKIHAAGATLATDFNVIVNARSHGVTASDSSFLYVTGKAGTSQIGFTIAAFPVTRYAGALPTEIGFLFNMLGLDHCVIDDRAKDVLSFGEGACIQPGLLYQTPSINGIEVHVAFQQDQKVLGVGAYKDPQSTNDVDGLVFFRTTPDGKFDTTYGPGANDSKAFVTLPGYNPRRFGVSENNEAVVWATHVTNGTTVLVRVSSQGVLLNHRFLGAEGDLGTEQTDLIVQADGKVVAAGASQDQRFITRFNRDFTIDLAFGYLGRIPTGARVAHVIQTEDGYVAVGQLQTEATLWRFDSLGRPSPGFAADGIRYPELGNGYFGSTFATPDRIFATFGGTNNHALVVSLHPDGTRDLSFGLDGSVDVGSLESAQLIPISKTSHSRAYAGVRATYTTAPLVRYEFTRFWY